MGDTGQGHLLQASKPNWAARYFPVAKSCVANALLSQRFPGMPDILLNTSGSFDEHKNT